MSILDNAKQVAELVKKYNDQELYAKLIDLRDEIFTLKEENMKLREQISQLESEAKINEDMSYEAPFYWLVHGDERDGPYCQKCFDSKKKRIRLQVNNNDYWQCLECKSGYEGPHFRCS